MNFKKKFIAVKATTAVLTLSLCFSITVMKTYAAEYNKSPSISINDKQLENIFSSINIDSLGKGKDIWIVDGKEVDKLPDDLLNELQKDPCVREALDLGNEKVQKNKSVDKKTKKRKKKMAASNIANTASHIKSINGTNISNVSITGNNLGFVIEKSSTNKFELDYAGVKNKSNFTFHDTITSDGTLTITASANSLVNYISADPNNKVNVINIKIPEKIYNKFSVNITKGSLYLSNIMGKVNISSNKSSIIVATDQFKANLNLNLKKSSLKFNVSEISNNINITGSNTKVDMVFNSSPKNLRLNTTKCKGSLTLPNGWSKDYKVGTNKPIVNLNITGSTEIVVK